jgi:hypothetical protein
VKADGPAQSLFWRQARMMTFDSQGLWTLILKI